MQSIALGTYLHPVLAIAVIAYGLHVARLGLSGRRRSWTDQRARHGRQAPVFWWLALGAWTSGVLSVVTSRPDLELAASWHFWVGSGIAALLTISSASRRWLHRRAVRAIHPWFGVTALVLAGLQVFLGFDLLP